MGLMPLMPSQQSSLSGTRTALMCHFCMAPMVAGVSSGWPPKMLQPRLPDFPPWAHENSVPEMLIPCRRTGFPAPSISWLPPTCKPVWAAVGAPSTSIYGAPAARANGTSSKQPTAGTSRTMAPARTPSPALLLMLRQDHQQHRRQAQHGAARGDADAERPPVALDRLQQFWIDTGRNNLRNGRSQGRRDHQTQ